MIHGLDGKKLSKRHGATAVADYQHLGILPGAMLNFLALLGWSPGDDIEVMTVERMIELFGRVVPAMEAAGLATATELEQRRAWFVSLLDLLKVRARTIDDVVRQAVPYFRGAIDYDPDAVAKQWKDRAGAAGILAAARESLAGLGSWEPSAMEEALRVLAERLGFGDKAGRVFQPLRVALTGLTVSVGIFDVLVMLGRDRALARIDDALTYLRTPSESPAA
jgi:glutamyl-tRNA synthetase